MMNMKRLLCWCKNDEVVFLDYLSVDVSVRVLKLKMIYLFRSSSSFWILWVRRRR